MSRDYAKTKKAPARRNQKNKSGGAIPGWVLFFSGVAFTLFGQLLFKLLVTGQPTSEVPSSTNKTVVVNAVPEARKPTITFHNTLKNMEVDVSDDKLAAVANPVTGPAPTAETTTNNKPDNKTETSAPPPAQFNSYLQAGSFKTSTDAEEHRAKLSMLGVRSQLEIKKNADGNTYYRVVTPSFNSASELDKARKTLNSAKIPTITLKR